MKVELVQAICGNSAPPHRVFLDRFVPLETFQNVLTAAATPRNLINLLTYGLKEAVGRFLVKRSRAFMEHLKHLF